MSFIMRTSAFATVVAFYVFILQRHLANTFTPSAQQYHSSSPKMFCYYSTYAQNRPEVGQFLPEDIDPELCTHIVMAFADIIQGTQLKASGWNDLPNGKDSGLFARTQALKQSNPRLKVLLAVGGWRAGSEPFVAVVNSDSNRKTFAENAAVFIRRHGFDGLDIDWEFPGSRGSGPEHKSLFTLLLKDLREAFEVEAQESGKERLLLTMAAAGGSYYIELAYEPSKIVKYVDYLLVMAYNYHGSWNQFTGHHSGLFPRSDEVGGEREWNQAWTIDYWLNKAGAPKEKVIIGIGTYGTTFTLASPAQHGLKAASTGPGEAGKYTKEAGTLAYYEICENLRQGWTSVWIDEQKVPYAYHEDQWVGYDNLDSVTYKAKYLRQKGVGGAFIWSLEMDDFRGSCGTGKYPLLSAIVAALSGADGASNFGQSDVKSSGRIGGAHQPSRSQQLNPDFSSSLSRSTTGSSQSRSRFSSAANSNDVVHSGSDVGEGGNIYQSRRITSGNGNGGQQIQRQHTGAGDYDDVGLSSSRRSSAATSFDDGFSSGNRQQNQRSRQDSSFAQHDVSSFRDRKFSGSDGSGSSWDDSLASDRSTDVSRGSSSHVSRVPPTRRIDDGSRRNSEAFDSDLLARGAGENSGRSRGGSQSSTFSETAGCSTSGVFVKPGTDCRAYYVCVQHGTSWHQFHMTCPQGTTFRTDLAACSDAVAGGATSGGRGSSTCAE